MFQIEGKLFFRSKKNLVAILVMLMTILSTSFLAGYHNRQAKLKVIQNHEQYIQNFENIIQDLETQYQKHTKISSEEISDGRKYSLLFLYDKVEVSC